MVPLLKEIAPVVPLIESAELVVVANVVGEEVEIKRFPAIERKFHGALVAEPSASVSCGAVDEAMVSI